MTISLYADANEKVDSYERFLMIENKTQQACRFLLAFIERKGGTAYATEIEDAAKKKGLSRSVIISARYQLQLPTHRQGFGKGARWFWSMPIQDTNAEKLA